MKTDIDCYWFNPSTFSNFGDALAPYIANLYNRTAVYCPTNVKGPRVFTVGSIADRALKNDIIVGTGKLTYMDTKELDVRAGRGPLSFPHANVFGDAALCLSFFEKKNDVPDIPLVFVPHHKTLNFPRLDFFDVLHPTTDVYSFIQKIKRSKLVMSESLHGLIIADALGIPNVRVKPVESTFLDWDFKFKDYYSGIGSDYPDGIDSRKISSIDDIYSKAQVHNIADSANDIHTELQKVFSQ